MVRSLLRQGERKGGAAVSAILVIHYLDTAGVSCHETPAKATRQAHRWLRRRVATPGEWATVLSPTTGATMRRYVRRADGRVERAQ